MHGGVKFYRGAPKAAWAYVERDRSRADDYYLGEGTGVATRITVGPDGPVEDARSMTGETYEQWVAGIDIDTGKPKGRLRSDNNGLRFVEVVVNGPKTWSLAASLHPEISAALDEPQEKAAAEIVGWLAQHATTRMGHGDARCRRRSRRSRLPPSGTTRPVLAIPAVTFTCRSTPASARPVRRAVSTRSGLATASRPSTGSDTLGASPPPGGRRSRLTPPAVGIGEVARVPNPSGRRRSCRASERERICRCVFARRKLSCHDVS